MIKISIITPSFNQGQFIEETILSVLSQEGNFQIEYIVADGGSTDGTVEIIRRYAELCASGKFQGNCGSISFLWWSTKDDGQAAAINEGMRKASGDIIAWINSDDYYLPGAFSKIINYFSAHQEVVYVYGDAMCLNEKGQKKTYKKSFNGNYVDLVDENFIHQSSSFWKKELLEKVGFLDPSLRSVLDYEYWLRVFSCLAQDQVGYLPECLSVYRAWPLSKTETLKAVTVHERELLNQRYGLHVVSHRLLYNPVTLPVLVVLRTIFPGSFSRFKKWIHQINNRKR